MIIFQFLFCINLQKIRPTTNYERKNLSRSELASIVFTEWVDIELNHVISQQISIQCILICLAIWTMHQRIPWPALRCHWSICHARPMKTSTIRSSTGNWPIRHREYPSTIDYDLLCECYLLKWFCSLPQWCRNADSLVERFAGLGNPVHAIRLHERWPLARPGVNIHCRRHMHVLRTRVGQLLAHTLSSYESAVTNFWRSGQSSLPHRPSTRAEIRSTGTIHLQRFPCARSDRLLLCVQRLCGRQHQTSARLLLRHRCQHTMVHFRPTALSHSHQYGAQFEAYGTDVVYREHLHGHRNDCHHVLYCAWFAGGDRTTSRRSHWQTAHFLWLGDFRIGRHRCCYVAGEQHEDTTTFHWMPECVEHRHVCGCGVVFDDRFCGLFEVRRKDAG